MSDDDDDMAELFSFGSNEPPSDLPDSSVDAERTKSPLTGDSSIASPSDNDRPSLLRTQSSDSFTELLGSGDEGFGSLLAGSPSTPSTDNLGVEHDQETQEMLDWLEDEDKPKETEQEQDDQVGDVDFDGQDEVVFVESTDGTQSDHEDTTSNSKNSTEAANLEQEAETDETPPPATVVELPPVFDNLKDALASPKATVNQIRLLAQKASLAELDDPTIRPDLYCRLICGGKNAEQTNTCSLADSFLSWSTDNTNNEETEKSDTSASWANQAAAFCYDSIVSKAANDDSEQVSQQDMAKLLEYHNTRSAAKDEKDVLVPCVAATILSAGIPPAAASVVLAQVLADFMPLTVLREEERWEAALALHHALYLLACYHLPLLVFHLDRYLPGWFGPRLENVSLDKENDQESADSQNTTKGSATERARNLDKQGQIPPSWLLTFLSGQVFSQNLPPEQVLRLWDAQITQGVDSAQSLRFFLTLAVLERAADDLILVTGEKLVQQLRDAFLLEQGDPWLDEWMTAAKELYKATPTTVLKRLQTAEDEAVQAALKARQIRAEAALQARLDAEAAAHKEAQEKKADEARQRLTRARLVAFYRKHAPEKEENIDRILVNYGDKLEVLDAKLFKKYGESFNPALKPKETKKPPPKAKANQKKINFLSSLGRRKVDVLEEETEDNDSATRKPDQVSVLVDASEVLPIVCWAKGGTPPKDETEDRHEPLKYFLVDSRSEEAAAEQGRFPTAVAMSPEAMLDPERIQQNENMFESLRGAVHIVVMGEGFSAIPELYQQKLSPSLEAAMVQDESRTNICALFFIKKGFPFVSVLDGGFASAHAWLARDGEKHGLRASSVLVDYDPEASIFGQMETLHNASMTEKAQRQLNNLVEKSLVAMTLQAAQFERMAADMEAKKQKGSGVGGIRLGNFFRGASNVNNKVNSDDKKAKDSLAAQPKSPSEVAELKLDGESDDNEETSTNKSQAAGLRKTFRNPFARKEGENNTSSSSVTSPIRLRRSQSTDPSPQETEEISAPSAPKEEPGSPKTSAVSSKDPESDTSLSKGSGPGPAAGVQNLLKRNPFRGFGGGGNHSQPPAATTKHERNKSAGAFFGGGGNNMHQNAAKDSKHERNKSVGAFAGLNNLRKSTLGRMRSNPTVGNEKEDAEESVSFD